MRKPMRLTVLVLVTTLLGACTNMSTEPIGGRSDAVVPEGTPATTSSPASGGGMAGAEEGTAPATATPSLPVAGSNAPAGYVELRGEGDNFHAAMTEGDGEAEPMLLTDPPLSQEWQVVEADGPKFVQTVCGVQLDPVEPRDAAHRRWGWVENFTYLTSEVHLFSQDGGGVDAATAIDTALEGCTGFGLDKDGKELSSGSGTYEVTVERLDGLPQGWVGWTEVTEGEGMVRHNALRDVEGGWHWISVVGYLGADSDADLLVAAVKSAG